MNNKPKSSSLIKSLLFKKANKIKSQPNIFKNKKRIDYKCNKSNKGKLIKAKDIGNKHCNRVKTARPISALQFPKKGIEDYYSTNTNTNTTATSRKATRPSTKVNQSKSSVRNTEKMKNTTYSNISFIKTNECFNQHKINDDKTIKSLKQRVHEFESRKYSNIPLINQKFKTISTSSENCLNKLKMNEKALPQQDTIIKVMIRKESKKALKQSGNHYYKSNRTNGSMDLSINERISNLYAWDARRKHKIEEMKEESIQRELKTVFSRPKINDVNVNKSTQSNPKRKVNSRSVIIRLYKEDPIKIKEKRDILAKILEPSFTPKLNSTKNTYTSSFNTNIFQSKNIKLNHLSLSTEALIRNRLFNNTYSS